MDRALPLDVPHHLRHRVLGRNREQHMHVIGQQVPLFNPTLLLLGQLPEHLPKMPPQFVVERFATILRNKHHMIFAFPLRMA